MPHLFGKRIRLRAVEQSDLDIFCRWINDPEITENLLLVYPMSQVEEARWYENMLQQPPSNHVMVIDIQTEKQPDSWQAIGNCGFMNFDWRNRSAEIGIMIGEKDQWNKGYGTEAMRLMCDYGFNTLNLHRIFLRVFEGNERGKQAYKKAGFIHEGTMRQAHFRDGRYWDVDLMSILKTDKKD